MTAGTIRGAIADGCDSVAAVRRTTGASGGCGGCAVRVEALLQATTREEAPNGRR